MRSRRRKWGLWGVFLGVVASLVRWADGRVASMWVAYDIQLGAGDWLHRGCC
jgi:hypothetical protein